MSRPRLTRWLAATAAAITLVAAPLAGATPAGAATPTQLRVSSPEDVLGLGSRMVFSTVKSQFRAGHALTLRNAGTSTLQVKSIVFGGAQANDFKLNSGVPTAFNIAPGASASVNVNYRPAVNGATLTTTYLSQATMTITTSDSAVPQYVVTLGGLNARDYEDVREPSLQAIFDALGYKTNAGVTNRPKLNSVTPYSGAVGDEVISAYWKKLDTTKSVTLFPVAHYSGKTSGNSAGFGWLNKGSNPSYLYNFPGGADGTNNGYGQNQLLLPKTTTNNFTFNPAASFGIADSEGNRSMDNFNSGRFHNLRFYKAKNASGAVIPGAYLVGDDIGTPLNNPYKNWDAQDYVFLLLNAQPDGGNDQPVPGTLAQTLEFNGGSGGLSDTGFTGTQGAFDASKISLSGGRLQVVSSDGSNSSHTNALQIPINSGSAWRVQSRFVGPFDGINAGSDQQALFWGTDATHYVKGEVEWNPAQSKRKLTIWQQNGSGGSIRASVDLPGNNASTIDLRFDGDITVSSGKLDVYYSVNGGSFVLLGSLTNIGSLFTAANQAGVWASHQGGGSQFTAKFENLVVSRRY